MKYILHDSCKRLMNGYRCAKGNVYSEVSGNSLYVSITCVYIDVSCNLCHIIVECA